MTPSEVMHANLYLGMVAGDPTDWRTISRWLGSIRRAWRFAAADPALTLKFVEAMEDRRTGNGAQTILDLARAYEGLGDRDQAERILTDAIAAGEAMKPEEVERIHARLERLRRSPPPEG